MTPETVYRRIRASLVEEGSKMLEESAPSRLRATQGAREFLLTYEVRIDATPTGSLLHMTVTSPSDWDAHLRLRRGEFRKAFVLIAIGLGFMAAAVVLAALHASSGEILIFATFAGSFPFAFGLVDAIKARARYRQARRFADARGTVQHVGGI